MSFGPTQTTLLLALAAAMLCPTVARAQARPATQRVLSRGAVAHIQTYDTARKSDRLIFGRIDAIRGSVLSVRARTGRLIRVDASEAIRTDAYSQPLFNGKIVVVDGYYDAMQTLHARSVMRMGALDASTGPDR